LDQLYQWRILCSGTLAVNVGKSLHGLSSLQVVERIMEAEKIRC